MSGAESIPYLRQQQELLDHIDTARSDIELGFKTQSEPHGVHMETSFFDYLYNGLKRQIGWDVAKPKRLRWLERFLSVVAGTVFFGADLLSLF